MAKKNITSETLERKNLIDSYVTSTRYLTQSMIDYYDELKKKFPHAFYSKYIIDEVLFHIIYNSTLTVGAKIDHFDNLGMITNDEEVKASCEAYINRYNIGSKIVCSASNDHVFVVYCLRKGDDNSNLSENFIGIFDSLDHALGTIKADCKAVLEKHPEYEDIVDNGYYLIRKIKVLDSNKTTWEQYDRSDGYILADTLGRIIMCTVEHDKDDKELTDVLRSVKLLRKKCVIKHPFKPGDVVVPRWSPRDPWLKNDTHIYFVRPNQKNIPDNEEYNSGLYLTEYDIKTGLLDDIDIEVSPFTLSYDHCLNYADDAYLYDFITKYTAYLSGSKKYPLTDVLNAYTMAKKRR